MAKEDFCYTFYDGDASRDVAHMNRLERGAYYDLIVSQRKFGHLSYNLIKKTLGNDFEDVWEALEVVLKIDADGKFYIEWLHNSIEKMRRQSEHQSKNGSKGGRPKKPKQNPTNNPNETQTITQEKPLENGDGYIDEDNSKDSSIGYFGKSENLLDEEEKVVELSEAEKNSFKSQMLQVFKKHIPDYPDSHEDDVKPIIGIGRFIADRLGISFQPNAPDCAKKILEEWDFICAWIAKDKFHCDLALKTIKSSMQTIYQRSKKMKHGTHQHTYQPTATGTEKLGTSEGRMRAATNW